MNVILTNLVTVEYSGTCTDMAAEIAALKLKHAEHILEVVRGAEREEAVRQKKLRHATSKENLAYLQKR